MTDRFAMAGAACVLLAAIQVVHAAQTARSKAAASPEAHASQPARHARPRLDTSGKTRIGKASFYSAKFKGRKMADGTPMDPQDDNAASKTLPLGTTAKVTNLETGESAVVTIRDRGPHVPGRIVDLSPSTAREVGIDRHDGVAKVAVTPLSLPASAVEGGKAPAADADASARRPAASRDSKSSPR